MTATSQHAIRDHRPEAQSALLGPGALRHHSHPAHGAHAGLRRLYNESRGHVVTVILLAMVAMLFTSISYGRMARVYPHGGSAFLYVGKEIHPSLGYITGWCLVMDYVLNPLICTIWCSRAAMNFLPGVPYFAWAIFFALLVHDSELQWRRDLGAHQCRHGCRAGRGHCSGAHRCGALDSCTSRIPAAAFFLDPFYNRASFNTGGLLRGTSIAVLTYIGFDGISTLTDEAKDPARSVPRAIVLTCFITGILASIEVYVAQLVWPRGTAFPDIDTAYVHVSGRMGGPILFAIVNASLLLANIGSGMASQLGAARLLYAMGQDGALPRRFLRRRHPKNRIPRNNVLLIGAICLAGALIFSYRPGRRAAELRRAAGIHGCQCLFDSARLASRPLGAGGADAGVAGRHGDLRTLVVESRPHGEVVGTCWAIAGILLWIARRRYTVLPGEAV